MFLPQIPKMLAEEYERQRLERARRFHAEEARSELLQCRVTAKEKELIERSAKNSGLTVSEYVRFSILMKRMDVRK